MEKSPRTSGLNGYLGLAQVLELVPVSRSTLYSWVATGYFPSPRQIGPRRVAWLRAEVYVWLGSRQRSRTTCKPGEATNDEHSIALPAAQITSGR